MSTSKLKKQILELLKQHPGLYLHEIQNRLMSNMTLDSTVDEYDCRPHDFIEDAVGILYDKQKLDVQFDYRTQIIRYYVLEKSNKPDKMISAQLHHRILSLLESTDRWMSGSDIGEIVRFEGIATPEQVYKLHLVHKAAKLLAESGKVGHYTKNGTDYYHHKKTRPRSQRHP